MGSRTPASLRKGSEEGAAGGRMPGQLSGVWELEAGMSTAEGP